MSDVDQLARSGSGARRDSVDSSSNAPPRPPPPPGAAGGVQGAARSVNGYVSIYFLPQDDSADVALDAATSTARLSLAPTSASSSAPADHLQPSTCTGRPTSSTSPSSSAAESTSSPYLSRLAFAHAASAAAASTRSFPTKLWCSAAPTATTSSSPSTPTTSTRAKTAQRPCLLGFARDSRTASSCASNAASAAQPEFLSRRSVPALLPTSALSASAAAYRWTSASSTTAFPTSIAPSPANATSPAAAAPATSSSVFLALLFALRANDSSRLAQLELRRSVDLRADGRCSLVRSQRRWTIVRT